MDAVFMTLAELAKQNREQATEIEALKTAQTEDRERLNAHGMLLTQRIGGISKVETAGWYRDLLAKQQQEAA